LTKLCTFLKKCNEGKKNRKNKELFMKMVAKIAVIAIVMTSIFLSACAPPPPPVSRDQLVDAEKQALAEEEKANELAQEKETLEEELSAKQAELRRLEQYKHQLETE
jgi:hypothetical protein